MDWESIISLYKYWVESKLFVLCFVGGQWIIKVLRVLKERDAGDWVHSGQATSGRQRDDCDHIGTVRSVCSCQCQGNGQLTRYVSMTSCLDWNVSSWYTQWMCSIWKSYSEGAYFNLSWCVKQDTDNYSLEVWTWSSMKNWISINAIWILWQSLCDIVMWKYYTAFIITWRTVDWKL